MIGQRPVWQAAVGTRALDGSSSARLVLRRRSPFSILNFEVFQCKYLARDVKLYLLLGGLLGQEVLEDGDRGDVVRLEQRLAPRVGIMNNESLFPRSNEEQEYLNNERSKPRIGADQHSVQERREEGEGGRFACWHLAQ